jgi:ankyrin repeat protein
MNKKTRLAIFVAITALSNNNLCMETEEKDLKQLLVLKTDDDLKKLKNILEKNIVDNYSAIHPALQYEMLKTYIENNNMLCLFLCLGRKFNPNRYHKGLSLLHHAIERNNIQALWFLADANPDLVPRNDLGETPLDYAIRLKHNNCIDVMSRIIKMKYNDLAIHKSHCGLTKHILKPERPCRECLSELSELLRWHGLSVIPYSETSNYDSTATDANSSNGASDSHS